MILVYSTQLPKTFYQQPKITLLLMHSYAFSKIRANSSQILHKISITSKATQVYFLKSLYNAMAHSLRPHVWNVNTELAAKRFTRTLKLVELLVATDAFANYDRPGQRESSENGARMGCQAAKRSAKITRTAPMIKTMTSPWQG